MKVGAVAFSIAVAGLVSTAGLGTASASPNESGQQSSSSPSGESGTSSTGASEGSSSSGTHSTAGSHRGAGDASSSSGTGTGPTSTVSAGGTSITRTTHGGRPGRPFRGPSAHKPGAGADDTSSATANAGSGDDSTTNPTSSTSSGDDGTPSVTAPRDDAGSATRPNSSSSDRDASTPRSDRRATDSATDGRRKISVTPAVGSGGAPSDDGQGSGVTARPTTAAASRQSADPTPAVSVDPVAAPSPQRQPASITVDPVVEPVAIATPAEPVATVTPVPALLSSVGLGLPLSANDGPAPAPTAEAVGSLELVRRELEQVSDAQSANDNRETATTNSLVTVVPPVDAAPDSGTGGATSTPVAQSAASTAADRAAAFAKAQADRIAAFATDQQARLTELQQQIAQAPLSAIIRIPVFVVTEAVRMAVFAVSEVIHTAVFAVSEFFHAISDALNPDPGTVGGGGSVIYGDPVKNAQYFQAQNGNNTCVLMSTAMIIAQLTGKTLSEADMVAEASSTNSVEDSTKKMYDPQDSGVAVKDAVALLDKHGVTATTTTFDKSEGVTALNAMATALADNKAVMVGVHGATVWSAVENKPMPEGERSADHQVVVIGYDPTKKIVYLNDSGFGNEGKNMAVPLDAFMKAWQADSYETTVAVAKVANQGSQSPASTNVAISGTLVTV